MQEKINRIKENVNYLKSLSDKLNGTYNDFEMYNQTVQIQSRLHSLCADIQTVLINKPEYTNNQKQLRNLSHRR